MINTSTANTAILPNTKQLQQSNHQDSNASVNKCSPGSP